MSVCSPHNFLARTWATWVISFVVFGLAGPEGAGPGVDHYRRPRVRSYVPGVMALVALAVCWSLRPMSVYAAAAPNILVLMTDDQDARSVQTAMTQPGEVPRLKAEGTTFTRFFVSYSLCCPSRAAFLTGQYAHNHKVMDNKQPLGEYLELDYRDTLPVWLQQVGYYTTHIGKFLNGYGQSDHPLVPGAPPYEIPQGWNE